MPEDAKLKELQKNRRLSLLHMRRGGIIFGVTAAVLLALQYFIDIRLWIPFVILGVLSFTVVGDVISYFYCSRRIRRMERNTRP